MLEGYLHQLSPIKTATKSQTNFFDCILQISKQENVRLVCYSPKQRPTLQQGFEKKSPIKITETERTPRDCSLTRKNTVFSKVPNSTPQVLHFLTITNLTTSFTPVKKP